MNENGYITDAVYDSEARSRCARSRTATLKASRPNCRRATTLPMKSAASCPKTLARASFSTGGLTVRATIDHEMQPIAANALRRELEQYDRRRGIWRGTGKTSPRKAGTKKAWRALGRRARAARYRSGQPVVSGGRAGSRRQQRASASRACEDADGTGSRPRTRMGAQAAGMATGRKPLPVIFEVGDVVHVRR